MNNEPILKSYYREYLLKVRMVSESTVKHYYDALNKNSRLLKKLGLVKENIYELHSYEELTSAIGLLLINAEFIQYNSKGNNMYSSALMRYLEFAKGCDFASVNEVSSLDIPVVAPESQTVNGTKRWRRSPIIKVQSLEMAAYRCEINSEHETFICKSTDKMFMEGHHAIPMKYQDNFDFSLDVYANIICLCPVCHRMMHYGRSCDKERYIDKIYLTRVERLIKSGLDISKDEFRSLTL